MAKSDQHRMVFDLRGRRKNVVKVVYAVLAVLMGLSLFFVTGSASIGDLFNGGSGSGSVSQTFDDQAAKLETQLKKQPQNEDLWLALAKNRFNAGNVIAGADAQAGNTGISGDAAAEYKQGADAWARYLKFDPKPPNATVASYAARASFQLAATSTSYAGASQQLRDAAAAQAVAAAAQPSASSYGYLAYFSYLAGDFKTGDEANSKAVAEVPKSQQANIRKSLAAYRKQGKKFQQQAKAAAKAQQGQGKKELQNPLGGLAGGGLGGSTPTPTP